MPRPADRDDRQEAAGDAERPGHRRCRDHRPRLTVAPIARLMPPVSMRMACAIATSASGNQLWVNFAKPGHGEKARETGRRRRRGRRHDHDEQAAQAAIAPAAAPASRGPCPARGSAGRRAHAAASGCAAHGGGDDRLLAQLVALEHRGDAAFAEDGDPVAEMDELRRVGAEQDNRLALGGQAGGA